MKCPKCGNTNLVVKDGKEIGSFPDIKYYICISCGNISVKKTNTKKK